MNSYLSSTDQWTFQQEEELDGMTTLKFSGTVTGSQVSALMEESGVLDSLGTMQQLGVSTENLQGMLQDLGDMTIEMWIDPEICYPVRYEMDMTQVCNTLMEHVLQVLEDMGQSTDGVSILKFRRRRWRRKKWRPNGLRFLFISAPAHRPPWPAH